MTWVVVYESPFELETQGIKDLLESYAIPAQVLNQKDTAYIFIGEVRILVPASMVEDARKVLTINGYLHDESVLN